MKLLDSSEYPKRRQTLMKKMSPDSAIILASGRESIRNADTHYRFRVDSDFYYLTGFKEPNAIFILRPGLDCGASVLFCQPRDPATEQWDGRRLGPERAPEVLSIAAAFTIDEIDQQMPKLLDGVENLYFPMGRFDWLDDAVGKWHKTLKNQERKGLKAPAFWSDIDGILHELRCIKSHSEFEQMWAVAEISAHAHRCAMHAAKPGIWEYQLEGILVSEMMKQGCSAPAYPSIVAGGSNANILHYVENNQQIKDGDLVLIDAGGELDCYAADITRTFPVNGRYSPAQKILYNIVLKAQLAAIDAIKPGVPYESFHNAALEVLVEGLIEIGILHGSVESNIEQASYKPYFMHRTGHFLGMDVHDVGSYKKNNQWVPLKAGMVVTVEPGLYIPENDPNIPQEFQGIGIRIEDDIVVTEKGANNLTYAAPKTIEEIESWMAEAAELS